MRTKLLSIFLGTLMIAACGDISQTPEAQPTTSLVFSATNPAKLTTPISGMSFTVTLPADLAVKTVTGNPSGQVAPEQLSASNIGGTSLAFGVYSASTHKLHLTVMTSSNTYNGGEFLRVECNNPTNSEIDNSLLLPPSVKSITAFDNTTMSSVDLTNSIGIAASVVQTGVKRPLAQAIK